MTTEASNPLFICHEYNAFGRWQQTRHLTETALEQFLAELCPPAELSVEKRQGGRYRCYRWRGGKMVAMIVASISGRAI